MSEEEKECRRARIQKMKLERINSLEKAILDRLIRESKLSRGYNDEYRIIGTCLTLKKSDNKWYLTGPYSYVLRSYEEPLHAFWDKVNLKEFDELAKEKVAGAFNW